MVNDEAKKLFLRNNNIKKYLCITPPLFGFCVVLIFGVNVYHSDEWSTLGILDNLFNNGLNFGDLFSRHNEHRMFFPRIIFLLNAYITNLNTKAIMFLSWFFMCISYYAVIHYLRQDPRHNILNSRSIFIELMLGFLMFSTIQTGNTLWGFQIAWIMIFMCAVLSGISFQAYCESHKYRYLFILYASAFVASFSSLHGLFILPAILAIIMLLRLTKYETGWRVALSILLLALIFSAVYFYGWKKPGHHPALFAASLKEILAFVLSALGSPLIPEFSPHRFELTVGVGFVVLSTASILLILLTINRKISEHIFPLVVLVFSFIFILSITAARVGFVGWGSRYALQGRYTTFSLLTTVSIIIILYREFILQVQTSAHQKSIVYVFHCVFFMIMMQNCYPDGLSFLKHRKKNNREILLTYQIQDISSLKFIFNWRDINSAKKSIDLLAKHGWSVFADKKPYVFSPYAADLLSSTVSTLSSSGLASLTNENGIVTALCSENSPFLSFSLRTGLELEKNRNVVWYLFIEYSNTTVGNLQVFYDYSNGLSKKSKKISQPIGVTGGKWRTMAIPIIGYKAGSLTQIRIAPPIGAMFSLRKVVIERGESD